LVLFGDPACGRLNFWAPARCRGQRRAESGRALVELFAALVWHCGLNHRPSRCAETPALKMMQQAQQRFAAWRASPLGAVLLDGLARWIQ
jgi:hypothetical protein